MRGVLVENGRISNRRTGRPVIEIGDSMQEWFEFLDLRRRIRCVDVGAMDLGSIHEPWLNAAQEGCVEVIGFEPIPAEFERLIREAATADGSIRYLPFALGDGKEHVLHITNVPMTSSLFAPAVDTVSLFPGLGELMQVVKTIPMPTKRLDDLMEIGEVDFLKLDVQGAELMVLENAVRTLEHVSVIQCEVEFVELYEGQPLFSDIDAFLRSKGFSFLKFTYTMGRPFKPLLLDNDPCHMISQMLWGDALYVKDFRERQRWDDRILRSGAYLLHEFYQAFDLAALFLKELDRRDSTCLAEIYLASLVLGGSTSS